MGKLVLPLLVLLVLVSPLALGELDLKLSRAAALLGSGIKLSCETLGPSISTHAETFEDAFSRFSLHDLGKMAAEAQSLATHIDNTIRAAPVDNSLKLFATDLSSILRTLHHDLSTIPQPGSPSSIDATYQLVSQAFVSSASTLVSSATLANHSASLGKISIYFAAIQKSGSEVVNTLSYGDIYTFLAVKLYVFACVVVLQLIIYTICLFAGQLQSPPRHAGPIMIAIMAAILLYIYSQNLFEPPCLNYMCYGCSACAPDSPKMTTMPCYNPEKLITVDTDGNTFRKEVTLNSDLLQRLSEYPSPFYIHASMGVSRAGKSTCNTIFMRNLFSGKNYHECNSLFKMQAGDKVCTEGLWVWAMPVSLLNTSIIPLVMQKEGGTLVMIDTEGLAAIGQNRHLATIGNLLTIATLLSSSLTMHSLQLLNEYDLDAMAAIGTLARVVAWDMEENATQRVGMMADWNVLVTDATGYEHLSEMQNGSFDISSKLEEILAINPPTDATGSLQTLFPVRHMYGGVRASKEELIELNQIHSVNGIPDHAYSRSLATIWKQMLQGLKPKEFKGVRADGKAFRQMLEAIHSNVSKYTVFNRAISLASLFGHFKELTLRDIGKYLDQIKKTKLESEEVINKKLKQAQNDTDKIIVRMQRKIPNFSEDMLKSLQMEAQKMVEDLRKSLLNTYWYMGSFGHCDCTTRQRERKVVCKRTFDNLEVADEHCKNQHPDQPKPETVEKCSPEQYKWVETEEYETCVDTCPGKKKKKLVCMDCGKKERMDRCKNSTLPTQAEESCEEWTYDWNVTDWSPCFKGQKTRSVECMRCDSKPVRDACIEHDKPGNSQSCSEPGWFNWRVFFVLFVVALALLWCCLKR